MTRIIYNMLINMLTNNVRHHPIYRKDATLCNTSPTRLYK